jgi:hypothetical protein
MEVKKIPELNIAISLQGDVIQITVDRMSPKRWYCSLARPYQERNQGNFTR